MLQATLFVFSTENKESLSSLEYVAKKLKLPIKCQNNKTIVVFSDKNKAKQWCKQTAAQYLDDPFLVGDESDSLVQQYDKFHMGENLFQLLYYIIKEKLILKTNQNDENNDKNSNNKNNDNKNDQANDNDKNSDNKNDQANDSNKNNDKYNNDNDNKNKDGKLNKNKNYIAVEWINNIESEVDKQQMNMYLEIYKLNYKINKT